MMEIKKIYIDMDGVIVDFAQGIKDLLGVEIKAQGKDPLEDEMWEAMKSIDHLFAKLKPIPGAIEMLGALHAKYGDRCEILTAIPKPKRKILYAREDKLDWIKRYISFEIPTNIVYRAEKKQFSKGKEYILIDDFQKNIDEWEASGGTGILFESVEQIYRELDL